MPHVPFPNDEQALRIAYLIAGFIRQTLTEKEHDELDQWVEASDDNMLLFEELTHPDHLEHGLTQFQQISSTAAYAHVRHRLSLGRRSRVQRLWPYLSAACVLLAVAALWHFRHRSRAARLPVTSEMAARPPASRHARLTLADGTVRELANDDSARMVTQGNATLHIQDSRLWYERSPGDSVQALLYNTVTTPLGGDYELQLSDGTHVRLNAGSSLRFPVSFGPIDRRVDVTGEVYFDVAHDPQHPFIVSVFDEEIKVLGTRFNVNAYDRPVVTLVKGRVALSVQQQHTVLEPGQSMEWTGSRFQRPALSVEEVTSWTEGRFYFEGASIEKIMGQLSRWYDVDIQYEGDRPTARFYADILRTVPLSKALSLLEKTGHVHFQQAGRRLLVRD